MAKSYQQMAAGRKLLYFGLIAGLFTLTIFWRGKIPLPGFEDKTILAQARDLEMREVEQGTEADLTGNAVSLSLTGSRGLAVSGLWWLAMEAQRRHEWDQLELLVRSITKLQPHFITPWMFQSWNISYNVSVESDRLNDMYFYIARGIELLAEGERRNKNNPDLRWWIAFTYQNKFGVSDKVSTLRCMYQLSCIPPQDRDPKKLMGDNGVNLAEFRKFCEANPQLVRRLRETPIQDRSPLRLAETPEAIVQFLRENSKLPSRYKDARERASASAQFPILPYTLDAQGKPVGLPGEIQPDQEIKDIQADAFLAAKAWYVHSLDPLPDPTDEPIATPDFVPKGKRLPRKPALIIFRQGPPRAQSYLAERMQKEGWFDKAGWEVDAGYDVSDQWFPSESGLKFGAGDEWSQREWRLAHQMWKDHGTKNALLLPPEKYEGYRKAAQVVIDYLRSQGRYDAALDSPMLDIRPEERDNPQLAAGLDAQKKLVTYTQNLSMTNFNYFLYQAEAEMDDLAVKARRLFFQADKQQKAGFRDKAIALNREAMGLIKQLFEAYPAFHRDNKSNRNQEDAFERQLTYTRLLRDRYGERVREQAVGLKTICQAWPSPMTGPLDLVTLPTVLEKLGTNYRAEIKIDFPGPFDGLDKSGRPWIEPSIREQVKTRQTTP